MTDRPADPEVAVVSVQSRDGRPLRSFRNYSTHYAGSSPISADYFAVFAAEIEKRIGAENLDPPFVAMLSNGTSGDANCCDFTKPRREFDRFTVGRDVAQPLSRRTRRSRTMIGRAGDGGDPADAQVRSRRRRGQRRQAGRRQAPQWQAARPGDRLRDRDHGPVARHPEIKLQAIRIGQLGITAMPNEVYGSTGLRIKAESPLKPTFNVSLANGYAGYLPPPDQHKLGGYGPASPVELPEEEPNRRSSRRCAAPDTQGCAPLVPLAVLHPGLA